MKKKVRNCVRTYDLCVEETNSGSKCSEIGIFCVELELYKGAIKVR